MPYYVNRVHKASASDRTHQHIVWVCLEGSATHYTRAEVVNSINRGDDWRTRGPDGSSARIKSKTYCPHGACMETPYITTEPDHTVVNNLDNLPAC